MSTTARRSDGQLRPLGKRYPNKDAFASPALQAKLARRWKSEQRRSEGEFWNEERLGRLRLPF